MKYYDSLLKLPTTHPEVYDDFKNCWFGIKRAKKNFSGTPIDLTLEQTINADAASQRHGISTVTNSISARQRWAESHYLRTSITSMLFQYLGMDKGEDVSHYLLPAKVKMDNNSIKQVITTIRDVMNPFSQTSDEQERLLYNIATGKATSAETMDFLLNIDTIGENRRQQFITECIERKERFEERITKQKIKSFATEAGRKKITLKDGKVMAACYLRDLFGSLLYLSLEKKIDIGGSFEISSHSCSSFLMPCRWHNDEVTKKCPIKTS